jgi:hypothetical protein
MNVSYEEFGDYLDRRTMKWAQSERNLLHCDFVHHKSGIDFGWNSDFLGKTPVSSRLKPRNGVSGRYK